MGFFDHLLRDIRSVVDRDGGQNAIPPLDGTLSPNDRLDTAVPIGEPLPGIDDVIAAGDGAVYVTAGRQVLKLSGADPRPVRSCAEFEDDAGGLSAASGRPPAGLRGGQGPRRDRSCEVRSALAGGRRWQRTRGAAVGRRRRPMAASMPSKAASAAALASGGMT